MKILITSENPQSSESEDKKKQTQQRILRLLHNRGIEGGVSFLPPDENLVLTLGVERQPVLVIDFDMENDNPQVPELIDEIKQAIHTLVSSW